MLPVPRVTSSVEAPVLLGGSGCESGNRYPVGILRSASQVLKEGLHIFECRSLCELVAASSFLVWFISIEFKGAYSCWISQKSEIHEHGEMSGGGLFAAGVKLPRLLFVQAKTSKEVLWSIEKSLESEAFRFVVGELRDTRHIVDVRSTRRLGMRLAVKGRAIYLIVAGQIGATTAETRWNINPVRIRYERGGADPDWPCWRLSLAKNKSGSCGDQIVAFDVQSGKFVAANPVQTRTVSLDAHGIKPHRVGKVMTLKAVQRRTSPVDRR